MDIEEIHDIVEDAEQIQPFLKEEANRYADLVTFYYHTEDNECVLENGYAVEKTELFNEAQRFLNTIEAHEELRKKLLEAEEELKDANDFRYQDGKKLDKNYLDKKIKSILNDYQQDFELVLEVANRGHLDPDMPDPMSIRSKKRRQKDQEDRENLNMDWIY